MISNITYSNQRFERKIRNKHLIPYRVFPSNRYKIGRYYYNGFYDEIFKVDEVSYKNNSLEFAMISYDDGRQSYICTQLDPVEDYRLEKDKNKIYNKDIINTGKAYTGAEIVYWFFINNITSLNKQFKGFWKFVDSTSAHRISDNSYYYLTADTNYLNIYINCKVIREGKYNPDIE